MDTNLHYKQEVEVEDWLDNLKQVTKNPGGKLNKQKAKQSYKIKQEVKLTGVHASRQINSDTEPVKHYTGLAQAC